MFDFKQCDPKRCTGKKLERYGFVKVLKLGTKFPGLLLSPSGERTISLADLSYILNGGLAVVDCSWNQVFFNFHLKIKFRMPFIVKLSKNSSSESYFYLIVDFVIFCHFRWKMFI